MDNKQDNDDYTDLLLMKSFELGKKCKEKLLIFDMDETLIAARFQSRLPEGFQSQYEFDYNGENICVRFRPYLKEVIEKLSTMYEIVVFTAGLQDYADKILD